MLASRATTSNARAAFLQLPSHLRQSSHQHASRSFSASASRKLELSDIVVAPPLAVLKGLHAIGIPWYAAIPTAAILIRGIFGYYTAAVPSRRRAQIRNNLAPLIAADMRYSMMREMTGPNRPGKVPLAVRMQRQLLRTHQIGKRFGSPLITWQSFVNIATLITTSEAIRLLSGARTGLLSTVLSPFNWVYKAATSEPANPAVDPAETYAQQLAERMERVRAQRVQRAQDQALGADGQALSGQSSTSDNLFDATELSAPPQFNADQSYFDPTLQTEGLSWCADLTAVDPYGVLPVLTSALMLGSIFIQPLRTPRRVSAGAEKRPAWIRFLVTRYSYGQTFSMALSCCFGYLLQYMPAAVVLYIFSSAITGYAQRRWLDLSMPLPRPLQACVRATRVRSKKAWSGKV